MYYNRDPETLDHKVGVIEDHCETVGRDLGEIEYTWDGHVICTRDEEKMDDLLYLMLPIQVSNEYLQGDIETREDAKQYYLLRHDSINTFLCVERYGEV
jgi:hypothetical protein